MILSDKREVDAHSGFVREGCYKVVSVLLVSPYHFDYEEHPIIIKSNGKIIYEHESLKFLTGDERLEYIEKLRSSHNKTVYLTYTEDEREFFEEKYFTELI